MGPVDSGEKPARFYREAFVATNRSFSGGVFPAAFDIGFDGFDHQSARDLTGLMASHAVGDHIEPQGVFKKQGIFISFALFTPVGNAG